MFSMLWLLSLLSPSTGPSFRYTGTLQPRLSQHGLAAFVPVWRGDRDTVAANARFHQIGGYYDLQGGGSFSRRLEGGRAWSVSASYGSASDKPFKNSTVSTLGATAVYAWPESQASSWMLLLNYSNNRPFLNNVPLPGFVYTYAPSKIFRGSFGAPFAAIFWRFEERWALNLFTVVPWVLRSSVGYDLSDRVQLFAGFEFGQQTFLKHGRAVKDERVFFDERRAVVGVRSPQMAPFSAELEAGYAFGRRIFEAEGIYDPKTSLVELEAGPIARLNFNARFN